MKKIVSLLIVFAVLLACIPAGVSRADACSFFITIIL